MGIITSTDEPPTKRPRCSKLTSTPATGTTRYKNGVRGKLAALVDFPVELLYEVCRNQDSIAYIETHIDCQLDIFMFLQPRDLIHLSRTSKDIHALLMAKSSSMTWKAARGNLEIQGLPECPQDMNEAQYANLIFSRHCHVRSRSSHLIKVSFFQISSLLFQHCLKPYAIQTVLWNSRKRTCQKCLNALYVLALPVNTMG